MMKLSLFCLLTLSFIFSQTSDDLREQSLTQSHSYWFKSESDWADKLCRERRIDFGDVPVGKKVSHVFVLKNTTAETLTVGSVSVSCGCMEAKIDNKVIAPNGKAKLTVNLNSKKYRGRKDSTIRVRFSDSDRELQFTALVRIQNLRLKPETVDLTGVSLRSFKTAELLVTRTGDPSWIINKIEASDPAIVAVVKDRKIAGTQITYTITFKFSPLKRLPSLQQIAIFNSDPDEEVVFVPVYVGIADPIQVSTQQIVFDNVGSAEATRQLVVKTDVESTLSKLAITPPVFGVREIEPGKKKIHILSVSFMPNPGYARPQTAKLVIEAGKWSQTVRIIAKKQ